MDNKHTHDSHHNNGITSRVRNNNKLGETPTLKEYIPVLWRGKWIITIITLIVFNIAFLIAINQDPIYYAQVSLFINTKGQTAASLGGLIANESKSIGNELELLKSRMLAELVADRLMEILYLDEDSTVVLPILTEFQEEEEGMVLSSRGTVVGRSRRAVSFDTKRDADFITITARSTNRREATLIANTYAQVYYERNLKQSRLQSRSIREFLESQLSEKRVRLEEAEKEFKKYMEERGVVRIDEESSRVINQIAQLETQRESVNVEIKSLKNTLGSVKRQLEEEAPKVTQSISSGDFSYIQRIQEQIAELEVARDLTLTHNPGAEEDERYRRRIDEMDSRLSALRENLRQRTEEFMLSVTPGDNRGSPAGFIQILKQRILEQEIELQGLEFKQKTIDESLERYERQFEQLPQVNMEYAQLQRSRTSNEQLYLMLENRYNEALISEQSEFGSVQIIDEAQSASVVSQNMKRNLLLGFILGAGLGIGFVIGREHIIGPIRMPEDLQKHGYQLLAVVSSMDGELKKVAKNGLIFRKGKKINAHLILLSNPLSPSAESFRLIRTNLKYMQLNKKLQTIVFTSANPSEGKTTVISNVGVSFTQAGKKVLIVDADLRKPSVADVFDQASKPGLNEVLMGEVPFSSAIQKTTVDNLDFLASGSIPPNPTELLESNELKILIDTLGSLYDIILLDSPPVLAASDPLVLSSLADGVIMVAASDRTKMKEFEHAHESLQGIGAQVLGVVLNFFKYQNSYGSVYGYKYYRYGSYSNSPNRKNGKILKRIKSMK
jgi:capsular exopolysaccharide synthesis family protein